MHTTIRNTCITALIAFFSVVFFISSTSHVHAKSAPDFTDMIERHSERLSEKFEYWSDRYPDRFDSIKSRIDSRFEHLEDRLCESYERRVHRYGWDIPEECEDDEPVNEAPTVSLGDDFEITLPVNSASLDADVSDDGLPSGSLTYEWMQLSGPADVSFSSPGAEDTDVTFPEAGTYTLNLSVSDGALSDDDSITVTVLPEPIINEAPMVDAGSDQETTLPDDTVSLDAIVTDDGLPSDTLTYMWSKMSGPGDVVFSAGDSEDTDVTFSTEGTYVLKLTVSDGELSGEDTIEVVVNPEPVQNVAPTADAGDDQEITLPTSLVILAGSATDDDLPAGVLTYLWEKVSGPGAVIFGDATSTSTDATFSEAGIYVLSFTADDGELTDTDTVEVLVNEEPNEAPSVDVGDDQDITLPTDTVSIDAVVTDDGLPTGSLTYEWSVMSGSGIVTFSASTSEDTDATFSEAGEYVLKLTVNDGDLSGEDTLTVVVNEEPVLIDHLIFGEVYYDVDGDTKGEEFTNEWLEIYNPTGESVNIAGYTIEDNTDANTLPDVTIPAEGYVIVTASSTTADFWSFPEGVPVIVLDTNIGNGLGNTGDSLFLWDEFDKIQDFLSWGTNVEAFDPSAIDVAEGHSLARTDLSIDTDTAADWAEQEIPTPGE